MLDLSTLRIVEIGPPLIKHAFPKQTQCFSTIHGRKDADPANGLHHISLRTLPALYAALRAPDLSLVVCRPAFYAPWHWQWISRALFSRRALRGRTLLTSALGAQMLRLPVRAPIAVLDFEDYPGINCDRFFLLSRCRCYFKRELPPDRWRLFMPRGQRNLPSRRFRRQRRYRAWIEKIRPISLGLPVGSLALLPDGGVEKTTDIFFSGDVENSSTIRATGMRELKALRDRGLIVDMPRSRLPAADFYRRIARARLAWSPEGLGWDCFRHYEALACGTVPVINQPTIERHRPLIAGEHALYYGPEPGGLTAAINAALGNSNRLAAIAEAGKRHVLTHHTPEAIARYVIETTLGLAPPDGPL